MNTLIFLLNLMILHNFKHLVWCKRIEPVKEIRIFYGIFLPATISTRANTSDIGKAKEGRRGFYKKEKYCSLELLKKYDDCLEIGCQIGIPCKRKELSGSKCCLYLFQGKQIPCCRGKLTCSSRKEEKKIGRLKPVYEKEGRNSLDCPPKELPRLVDCMELGCAVGSICISQPVVGQRCCIHSMNGKEYSCCVIKTFIEVTPCYEKQIEPGKYHCTQMGCEIGGKCCEDQARTQTCCNYLITEREINCCLLPIVNINYFDIFRVIFTIFTMEYKIFQ